MVDADPQGNLTLLSDIEAGKLPRTFVHVWDEYINTQTKTLKSVIKPAPNLPLVSIVPTNLALSQIELKLVTAFNRERVLKSLLQPELENYDYIIIDTAPGSGLIAVNAMVASDYVIAPAEATPFGVEGIALLNQNIGFIRNNELNPNLKMLGVLVNKVGRTSVNRQFLEAIKENGDIPVFDTFIKQSVDFTQAEAMHRSVVQLYPKNASAESFRNLAKEVEAKTNGE